MSSKAERERTKQIQDKCQRLLNEMLKDDDNKYCVDCDSKGPLWASWNIGIFLCIRCAGIHRKLGVHISKVKSVNLDTWTPQQIVCLQQMGNSRARAVYEANLPDNFRRPHSEGNLESFIRAKYEHKKFIAREWVAPPLPKVNWDKEIEEEAEKLKRKKREGIQSNISSIRPLSTPPVIPQPLPKPQSSSPKPSRNSSHTTDLLGLDTPTKETPGKNVSPDNDLFTSFLAATTDTTSSSSTQAVNGSNNASTIRTEEEDSFFNQSLSSTPNKLKPLTKDSILALYGNPGVLVNPQLNVSPMGAGFNTSSVNGVSNSFVGQNITQPPLQQNDLLNSGVKFPNNVASTMSNFAFSSNPFYSMAASGGQSNFPSQKAFSTNFPSANGSSGADMQQAQFVQQMKTLNLNVQSNQFNFPSSNHFDANADTKNQQQANFDQSVSTTNFWQ